MIENAEWLSKFLDSHSNMESCFDYEMEWVEKMTTEDFHFVWNKGYGHDCSAGDLAENTAQVD